MHTVQLSRAQNHCKDFTKGIEESVNNVPAAFSFWVKISKRALNSCILSFYRKTGYNLEVRIYFWKKEKNRLTMRAGWKLRIRQKHKLVFGMRLNTCWSDSLFKILNFWKEKKESDDKLLTLRHENQAVSQSIPLTASSCGQGKK